MTRKRFVKLLMSHGYTRNEAETEAIGAQLSGTVISYAEWYAHLQRTGVLLNREIKYRISPVGTAAKNLDRALRKFAAALKNISEGHYEQGAETDEEQKEEQRPQHRADDGEGEMGARRGARRGTRAGAGA